MDAYLTPYPTHKVDVWLAPANPEKTSMTACGSPDAASRGTLDLETLARADHPSENQILSTFCNVTPVSPVMVPDESSYQSMGSQGDPEATPSRHINPQFRTS